MEIVQSVAEGRIPRDSGVQLIQAGFPLDATQAERIMGETGRSFNPSTGSGEGSPGPGGP